jgi:hypothetical protein
VMIGKGSVVSDECRVPIYCYGPEPCTRPVDMSSHSNPLGSRQKTTTRRPQCQCHALYSKDYERHVSCQRFSLPKFACERHARTCATILPRYKRCRCCINFGGVWTPRPQIIPKFLGSWRTAALGYPSSKRGNVSHLSRKA